MLFLASSLRNSPPGTLIQNSILAEACSKKECVHLFIKTFSGVLFRCETNVERRLFSLCGIPFPRRQPIMASCHTFQTVILRRISICRKTFFVFHTRGQCCHTKAVFHDRGVVFLSQDSDKRQETGRPTDRWRATSDKRQAKSGAPAGR